MKLYEEYLLFNKDFNYPDILCKSLVVRMCRVNCRMVLGRVK